MKVTRYFPEFRKENNKYSAFEMLKGVKFIIICIYYMNIIINFVDEIGKYGPIILIIISLYLLWNTPNLFFYYSIGVFVNSVIAMILKGILKQPRPTEDLKDFKLAIKNGKSFIFKDGIIPMDIYGMPSGHAQSVFFSSTFIFLALKKMNILLVYLFISLITIYQRIKYKYHTILQIIVGAIIGCIFAYYVYYLSKIKLRGIIREKPDDDGPI